MSNHLYGQRDLSLSYPTTSSRSAIDDHHKSSSLLLSSSLYNTTPSDHLPSSSSYLPSLRRRHSYSDEIAASNAGLWSSTYDAGVSRSFAASSFDLGSSLSKRSSEAIYGQSILGAHMVGQSEAWLTSDSLTKRPRLEIVSHLPIFPQRPGEKDCVHYMLTRTCKFGDSCKFDHPIWVPEGGIPDWKEPPPVPYDSHPERPGEPDCPYFLKTQKCKFGLNCKFHHPKDIVDPSSSASDLPDRPAEPPCSFYMKTGKCKFGVSCKFHHPRDVQIPSTGQEAGELVKQTSSIENTVISTVADANALKVPTFSPASLYNFKGLPMRPGETDCPFYMKMGSCKYGANCRYNHPERNAINPPVAAIGHMVVPSPVVNPFASVFQDFHPTPAQAMFAPGPPMYPQRPGETECEYFSMTGECKFGERCKFHHDLEKFGSTRKQTQEQNIKLTLAGLPRREGGIHCPFYMKTGTCGYGATCRFDHPTPGEIEVKASLAAAKETSASAEKGDKKAVVEKEKTSTKEG